MISRLPSPALYVDGIPKRYRRREIKPVVAEPVAEHAESYIMREIPQASDAEPDAGVVVIAVVKVPKALKRKRELALLESRYGVESVVTRTPKTFLQKI
jgi:hypothetical protein